MQQILQKIIKFTFINAYEPTNSLIMVASANLIRRALELIKALDNKASENNLAFVNIINSDVKKINEQIKQFIQQQSASKANSFLNRGKIILKPETNSLILFEKKYFYRNS